MLRDEPDDLLSHVVAVHRMNVEAIEECVRWRDTLLFMVHRSDPPVDKRRRRRLPKIVTDGAEHHSDLLWPLEIVDSASCLIDDLQRMDPDVALRMPFGLLR